MTADSERIAIEPPAPGQVLLVVSDGERHASVAIDRAHGSDRGWDESVASALRDLDGALAVERELARRAALPPGDGS